MRNWALSRKITKESVYGGFALLLGILMLWEITGFISSNLLLFEGYFANGAFQILNPMRRIAEGQLPGQDFDTFHGIGMLFMHLPLYILFGENLYSSELSRFTVSAVVYFIGYGALVWGYGWTTKTALIGLAVAGISLSTTFLSLSYNTPDLKCFHDPCNSLVGVRTIGYFIVAGMLLTNKPSLTKWGVPIISGLALLTATEHGIAITAAAILVLALRTGKVSIKTAVFSIGAFMAISSGVFLASLLILTNGHVREILEYNFKTVPSNQFWYFGAYPNEFLSRSFWQNLKLEEANTYLIMPLISLGLGVLASIKLITGKYGQPHSLFRSEQTTAATLFLAISGVLASFAIFGYVSPINTATATKNIYGISLLLLLGVLTSPQFNKKIQIGLLVLLVIYGAIGFSYKIEKNNKLAASIQLRLGQDNPVTIDGMPVSAEWAKHVEIITKLVGKGSLWSTYAGLVDKILGQRPNSRADYIIHAVGQAGQAEYLARLQKTNPDFVHTDTHYEWSYGSWLIVENWEIYRYLIEHYTPIYAGHNGTLWRRKEIPSLLQETPPVILEKKGLPHVFALATKNTPKACTYLEKQENPKETEFVEISVTYTTKPGIPVPFFNKLTRYSLLNLGSDWRISLPPAPGKKGTFTTVIKLIATRNNTVCIGPIDLTRLDGKIEITELTFNKLIFGAQNKPALEWLTTKLEGGHDATHR